MSHVPNKRARTRFRLNRSAAVGQDGRVKRKRLGARSFAEAEALGNTGSREYELAEIGRGPIKQMASAGQNPPEKILPHV